ncbi:hypothetical protein R1flu_012683 [Riccia fluitans]|uniref:Uncharacterized protein n=1 Tax=Riccia fluitans TaxID=41844 RepID=A0ABD1ZBC0_9MARC
MLESPENRAAVYKACETMAEPPVSSMNLALEYAAATVLTVEPLSTGLSVDVHGQVTILHRTVQMEIQPLQLKFV